MHPAPFEHFDCACSLLRADFRPQEGRSCSYSAPSSPIASDLALPSELPRAFAPRLCLTIMPISRLELQFKHPLPNFSTGLIVLYVKIADFGNLGQFFQAELAGPATFLSESFPAAQFFQATWHAPPYS